MDVAAAASGCKARTKCREAGTEKCACSAARSAHCSTNTSRSGCSQSTCTAWEMHPGSPRERWTCSRLNRRISSKESWRAVTLPVTTIMLSSRSRFASSSWHASSWNGFAGAGKVYWLLLRPALQRGMSGVGQDIDTALGAVEPAVDVVQQNFRRVGNLRLEIAHPPRPLRQRRGAGQRLLTIGGHDRRPRAAAQRRIALAAPVLGDEARAFFWIAARACGGRRDQHFDVAAAGDREHPETEPAAEIAVARVALAALAARRHFRGQPDLVAGAGAVDRLQHQFEIEGELQFANHHDRRIVGAERHQVAAADLALDREAELFQEAFDGQIQCGFQAQLLRSRPCDSVPEFNPNYGRGFGQTALETAGQG